MDRNYKYISINHNVFTKFNLKELIGKDALKFLPADVRALAKSKVDKCFATGNLQEFEHRMGDGMWAFARVVALRSSRAIDRVMIISTNITERKRAEEALTQKNIALGEMIKQIDYEKEKMKKEITINVEAGLCQCCLPPLRYKPVPDAMDCFDKTALPPCPTQLLAQILDMRVDRALVGGAGVVLGTGAMLGFSVFDGSQSSSRVNGRLGLRPAPAGGRTPQPSGGCCRRQA